METFSKTDAQKMRQEIFEALAVIEKKYNAKVELSGVRYGSVLKTTLSFSKLSENEHGTFVNTPKAQEYIRRATRMGLSADTLNEPMEYQGSTHVITGYNTRAKRYPIEYTKDGQSYKCSEQFMKKFVKETRPEFFL